MRALSMQGRLCGGTVVGLLSAVLLAGCGSPSVRQARSAPVAVAATGGEVLPVPADAVRHLPLQGALNARTFARLKGRDGPIPAGSFVRADDLARLTPADRDALAGSGVSLDVDLRTADEAGSSQDVLATDARFRYVRISLLGVDKIELANLPDSLGAMYAPALASNAPQFRQVFEAIAAQKEGTVLFHCTAGKDRTGMVAAILLSLAGVPRSEIVHDYAISAAYLKPLYGHNPQVAEMVKQNPKIAALMGTPPEAIEAFLDALERDHGGARRYLKSIGVRDTDVRSLLHRLGQRG